MKKMGRPEMDLNRKRDIKIVGRINNSEYDMLRYLQNRTGKTISEIIRIGLEMYFDEMLKN